MLPWSFCRFAIRGTVVAGALPDARVLPSLGGRDHHGLVKSSRLDLQLPEMLQSKFKKATEAAVKSNAKDTRLTRRMAVIGGAAAGWGILSTGRSIAQEIGSPGGSTRRNISSFRVEPWQNHFDNLNHGAILCDTKSRMLQYWSEDGSIYKLYPTSVPMSEELTRLGYTEVIQKVVGPDWAPTPSMIKRDPTLPRYWPPGPDNPLGTHALYLSWQYYRIHGSGDTRKVGRRSSNGCIGLYNEDIAELFALAEVGTQVKLI